MIKSDIVVDFNVRMGYVNYRMANSYSASHQPFRTVTPFLLHVVGRKFHTDFQLSVLRNVLTLAGQEWWLQKLVGRPATVSLNIGRLDSSFTKQWPGALKAGHCHMCCVGSVTWKVCVMWPCVSFSVLGGLSHKDATVKLLHMQPLYTKLKSGTKIK